MIILIHVRVQWLPGQDNIQILNKALQSNNEVTSEQTAPKTGDNQVPTDADDVPKIDKDALIATIPYEEETLHKFVKGRKFLNYNDMGLNETLQKYIKHLFI